MANFLGMLFSGPDYRKAAPQGGYADLYQSGLLARNRDQMPISVQGAQASQDFIPGIGDALALKDAYDAASRGDKVAAGLLATGAAIGLVPGAGDMVARPVVAAGRKAADFADRIEVDPNAFGSMGGNIRLRPQADGNPDGIRAFHGSPHSFDKFSMDKIGTGEGAQVYGHGLYFAEAEDVAKKYRDDLSGWSSAGAERTLEAVGGDVDRAIMETQQKLNRLLERNQTGAFKGAERSFNMQRQIQEDKITQLKGYKNTGDFNAGSMYEVNINANPEDLLDWDAPLSGQSEKVRNAWGKFLGTKQAARADERMGGALLGGRGQFENPTGRDFLGAYSEAAPHNRADPFDYQPKFSNALKRQGIPGIKYFDAGSRGTDAATRNFVVFDEKLISIVKKYGIAGAASILGLSQAEVAQAMQAQPEGLLGGDQ